MSEEKQIPDIGSREWTEIAREIRELKAQLAAVTKENEGLRLELGSNRAAVRVAQGISQRSEAENTRLRELLEGICNQVSDGRLGYFGDHTGYTPQISTEQISRWRAALKENP